MSITCAYLFYSGAKSLCRNYSRKRWGIMRYGPDCLCAHRHHAAINITFDRTLCNKIDMRLLVTFSFLMYAVCFTGVLWHLCQRLILQASFCHVFSGIRRRLFLFTLNNDFVLGLPDNKFANASSMSNFFRTCQDQLVRRWQWRCGDAENHYP